MLLGVLSFCGCSKNGPSATAAGMYFDTFITISAYDDTDESVLDEAIKQCEKYELIFSKTNTESELYSINNRLFPLSDEEISKLSFINNQNEALYVTSISKDMYEVLNEAISYAKDSSNAFNPALGSVTLLWDYHSDNPKVPDKTLIDEALKHTNVDDISVFMEKEQYYISIKDAELLIDLGGIAKGYIANRLRDYLIEKSCSEAVIALGGNIYCLGDKHGSGYNVGVQRPFGNKGDSAISIKASNTSVVTSGIYERHFEVDGHMYHHIISSQTGYPVENDLYGVTVICEDSLRADVLSTAFICMGKKNAVKYIEEQNDIKVIMNFQDGSILEKGF